VADDTGPGDARCRVDHAADDARRIDGGGDAALRIGGAHDLAFILAAMALEIPPGNAVLHRDQHGVVVEQRGQLIGDGLDLVGLDAEDDQVLLAGAADVVGGVQIACNLAGVVFHDQFKTMSADGVEVRAAGTYRHFMAGFGKLHGQISAY
jgi:hypothetical protein